MENLVDTMNISATNTKTANEIVEKDLQYIVDSLDNEFAELAGKRILITGGAGFLGYYLVQSLIYFNEHAAAEKAIEVVVYDNYMRGVPGWLKALEGNKNLHLTEHDITNPLPESIGNFEYIIHAASIASPIYYRKYPLATMDANVNGLRYLLEYARRQQQKGIPVEGFLFFSTSEIYGDPEPAHIPTPETYRGRVSCTGPRACYDESKRYGETLCVTFAKEYDIPVSIARPFNNYGPGLKITDKRVIPDFMRDVLSGKNITMYSDGSPSRTFCYIADAITGYFKILVNGKPGEPYNIGNSEPEITMKELAEKIVLIGGKLLNYNGKVEYASSNDSNYLVDNPNRRCPDITKAQKELGYNSSMQLEEGLSRNLIWHNSNRGKAN
jgi:dTDP-glucose 4,6-dehydratase/UDP-glucuronate decarboxylase